MSEDTPTGYFCECGEWHVFPIYVYSHWHVSLVHICKCRRANTIKGGAVISTEPAAPDAAQEAGETK